MGHDQRLKMEVTKKEERGERVWEQKSSGRNSRLTHNRVFRAGVLLQRSGPVPDILATHRPGAIMDKSGRRFVARSDWGANAPLRTQRAKIFSQLLTKSPRISAPTKPSR